MPSTADTYLSIIAAQSGLRRFVTAGNAAGLLATLSMTGAIIGASQGHPSVPREAFVTLALFILGLAISGTALIAEILATTSAIELGLGRGPARAIVTDAERDGARVTCENANARVFHLSLTSGAFLVVGTLLGLWEIYSRYVI